MIKSLCDSYQRNNKAKKTDAFFYSFDIVKLQLSKAKALRNKKSPRI